MLIFIGLNAYIINRMHFSTLWMLSVHRETVKSNKFSIIEETIKQFLVESRSLILNWNIALPPSPSPLNLKKWNPANVYACRQWPNGPPISLFVFSTTQKSCRPCFIKNARNHACCICNSSMLWGGKYRHLIASRHVHFHSNTVVAYHPISKSYQIPHLKLCHILLLRIWIYTPDGLLF